jgi:hypothetical protein
MVGRCSVTPIRAFPRTGAGPTHGHRTTVTDPAPNSPAQLRPRARRETTARKIRRPSVDTART